MPAPTPKHVPHFTDTLVLRHGPAAEPLLAGQLYPATLMINSMLAAETMAGRDGDVRYAIPINEVTEILSRHCRHAARIS